MRNKAVELRSGGGLVLTLFGIPFLLAGLGVICAGFTGSIQMEGGGQASPFFYLPFGGIFATVGAAFSMGRAGKRLEPAQRKVVEWWGLLSFPIRQTHRDWDDFSEVVLRKEIVRSKNSSRTVYRVYLEGQGEPCMMDTCNTFLASRRGGERVAKCIKLPLSDLASESQSTRQHDELDISLRDQMLKDGTKLELTAPPTEARSTYTIEDKQVVFELPASGFQIQHILQIAGSAFAFLLVAGFFIIPMGAFGDAPGSVKVFMLVVLSIFAVPLLAGVFSATKEAFSSRRVTLDQAALQVESRSPLGGSTQKIPVQQLEELELARSGLALEARSDHEVITMGVGLSGQEVSWLKNTIEYILLKM